MASEDVIELGSSEDEAEPVTKKMKPVPNAMVHIPSKIHGVTIKPTKSLMSSIPKELAGKNVTVTKISKGHSYRANPIVAKPKINGKPFRKAAQSVVHLPKPVLVQNLSSINPLNVMRKINSQVVINKVPPASNIVRNPIKIQSPATINKLPPSITITRTTGTRKRTVSTAVMNPLNKKQKVNQTAKSAPGKVLTVELDDDEVSSTSTATANPKWYIRPEDQTLSSLEETNNKEPEKASFVEITIEDSPVKPKWLVNNKACEIGVGTELSVTIDESPVKSVAEKESASGSDNENKSDKKNKQSKKKLEYPKESVEVSDSIEIEISPIVESEQISESVVEKAKEQDNIIEIEESPLKVHAQGTSTPKKDHMKPIMESKIPIIKLQDDNEFSEFNSVYGDFIKLCFQLENSDDMKKIVEKKIKAYYRQVPKEYTESEEFIDMVSSKIVAMKAGPEKMYLYIKDIVDELNLQRKMAKSQVLHSIQSKTSESDKFLYGEESEYDLKRQRQIRKLEKTLKKLHRAIQKLEEQEVDFDDDEDSVYLLTESDDGCTSNKASDSQLEKDPKALLQRYKERMVRVHAKFCQLTNTKMPSEPRVQLDARPGQPAGPAKRLEKWINKKVPIGTPLPFPDFHDVLRCVRDANDEDKLGWNEADIMEEARSLFTRCGKKLQRRRQENEWRLAASRLSVDIDPAEESGELKKKLEENRKLASKKETDVFNKYADRQSQLKLEAEEIGDKEAEESPVESDDDECNDESSLQNKEKRKERLKRLLHEQSKKIVENKDIATNSQCDVEMLGESENTLADKEPIEMDSNENKFETAAVTKESEIKKSIEKPESIKQKENNGVQEDDPCMNKTSHGNEDKTLNDECKKKELKTSKDKGDEELINENSKHSSTNKEVKIDDSEKIHSLSDDSEKLESDVDELHLLQKLHSGNEINTSISESSGCDTPIAISDTLESSDNSKKEASGVISIENSSYSESELNKDTTESKDDDESVNNTNKVVEELTDAEMECSTSGVNKKRINSNNEEYNESIEDILLASTDDDDESKLVDKTPKPIDEDCVNLKDDTISIGETVIEGVDKAKDNSKPIGETVVEEVKKAKDDTTSISDTAAEREGNKAKGESMPIDDTDVEAVDGAKDDTKSTSDAIVVAVGKANDGGSPTVESIPEDASSVDSVALVSTDDAVDEVTSDKEYMNHIIDSDSTEKQDDITSIKSVDSVVCLLTKDDMKMDIDSKDDEHTSKSLSSAEQVLDYNTATEKAKTNDTKTVQNVQANNNVKEIADNVAEAVNTVDKCSQNNKDDDCIEKTAND